MKQKEYRPMKNRKAHKGTMGAVLLLAALFTSCGADDPLPAGGPLRLTGVEVETGEGSAATRAAVTAVEAISVYATTEAHVAYGSNPFSEYRLQNNSWSADPAPVITANALLYACHPPVAGVTHQADGNHTVPVSVMTTAGATDFLATDQPDYLYGVSPASGLAPVTVTSGARAVSFRMKHALAKVSFRIVKSASANKDKLELVQIEIQSGTSRLQSGTGTMNLKTGVLNGLSSTSLLTLADAARPVVLKEQQATPNVSCLTAPMTGKETVLSFRLKVRINGESAENAHAFETKSVSAEWKAGYHYVYQITVDKMGGSLSSVKIDDWKSDANQNTSIGI